MNLDVLRQPLTPDMSGTGWRLLRTDFTKNIFPRRMPSAVLLSRAALLMDYMPYDTSGLLGVLAPHLIVYLDAMAGTAGRTMLRFRVDSIWIPSG